MTSDLKAEGEHSPSKLFRLIDANLNRLREGIRVCEDIARYVSDDKPLSQKLKSIRHEARVSSFENYLSARDIVGDVLKKSTRSESTRVDIRSIQIANIKRAQESARVLEESLKLIDVQEAEKFKQIRYALYDVEKMMLL